MIMTMSKGTFTFLGNRSRHTAILPQIWPCAMLFAESLQLCLTLCNTMDGGPPGSSVHRVLQARVLEWVAVSSSRGSSQEANPRVMSPALADGFFTTSATWEARICLCKHQSEGYEVTLEKSNFVIQEVVREEVFKQITVQNCGQKSVQNSGWRLKNTQMSRRRGYIYIYIYIADLYCCMAETNTTL